MAETAKREVLLIGTLIWSGHCSHPQTDNPEESHLRCQRNAPWGKVRKDGMTVHPCPCSCHLGTEDFDCGECGYLIREAPALGLDEDGDPRYAHVDEAGNIFSVECPE